MTLQVQRFGEAYGVLLTEEQMQSLGLSEGATVELRTSEAAEVARPVIQYITPEQAMRAYKATEAEYAGVYRALAK